MMGAVGREDWEAPPGPLVTLCCELPFFFGRFSVALTMREKETADEGPK
jgi:hypothetical protein